MNIYKKNKEIILDIQGSINQKNIYKTLDKARKASRKETYIYPVFKGFNLDNQKDLLKALDDMCLEYDTKYEKNSKIFGTVAAGLTSLIHIYFYHKSNVYNLDRVLSLVVFEAAIINTFGSYLMIRDVAKHYYKKIKYATEMLKLNLLNTRID